MAEEESKPFLDGQLASASIARDNAGPRSPSLTLKLTAAFLFLQVALIAAYTCGFLYLRDNLRASTGSTPIADLQQLEGLDIQWEAKKFTAFQNSAFTGPPSDKTDEAWEHLLENMTIRVTKEELDRQGQSSVALPDGGHMVWMNVHHELHCIKYLREHKYIEYYHPSQTDEEKAHDSIHADHCLEMLRSATLCRADTSLTTFHWEGEIPKPMLTLSRPLHSCVNYDALMQSVRPRVIGEEEARRLHNPNLPT